MEEIRILMVDDHNLFRESLGRLLESTSKFRVVGQSTNVAGAIETLLRQPADVILLDYDLGVQTGMELFAELKLRQSDAKILVVTAGLSDEATLRIMEAGASGIFFKHNSPDQIINAIARVAEGEVWLDNTGLNSLVAGRRHRMEVLRQSLPLTARQKVVLRGVLDGLSNKEIAWNLQISETSVKATIQELFRKAGVRTRSQLVRIAIERHASDWLKTEAGY